MPTGLYNLGPLISLLFPVGIIAGAFVIGWFIQYRNRYNMNRRLIIFGLRVVILLVAVAVAAFLTSNIFSVLAE